MLETLPATETVRNALPEEPQIFSFRFVADFYFIAVEDRHFSPPRVWKSEITTAAGRPIPTWTVMRTGRDTEVPLTVEVRRDAPADDFAEWENVEEESLAVPSGVLQLRNNDERYIPVSPGVYRLRFYARGLAPTFGVGQEGDEYRLVVWPQDASDSVVLKEGFPG